LKPEKDGFMHFRIDLQILTLEPQANGLTLIEGRAADGTDVAITVRVVEPLAVGDWMLMALSAEPSAKQGAAPAQSMRERMQARAGGVASSTTPRAAAGNAAPASPANNASSLLLSSILGSPAGTAKTANLSDLFDNAPLVERNVDDEMDALFGAPPRKG